MRHSKRNHKDEKEIQEIFQHPNYNEGRNFNLFIEGNDVRPSRKHLNSNKTGDYYPCVYCKGLYLKTYLKTHAKVCLYKMKLKPTSCNQWKNYLGDS